MWNFGWSEIGVAGRIEGQHMDRLKGNGETESLKSTELATNRQKHKKYYNYQLGITIFTPPFLIILLNTLKVPIMFVKQHDLREAR